VSIEEGASSFILPENVPGAGATLTSAAIIEPAIHAVAPLMRVVVTGFHVPEGASVVPKEVA
jgi:hypothetical protein